MTGGRFGAPSFGLPSPIMDMLMNQTLVLHKRTIVVHDDVLNAVEETFDEFEIDGSIYPMAYDVDAITVGGEADLGSSIMYARRYYIIEGEPYQIQTDDRIESQEDEYGYSITYTVTPVHRLYEDTFGGYMLYMLRKVR